MARRVFVHIGTPKSGTTVLQSVMFENRHALARAGLTVPALRPDSQFRAVVDLLGIDYAGWQDPLTAGAWDAVATAARAAPADAVISHEMLMRADDAQVDRAVESLQPAEVHVLVTVRHLARQVGSTWQENLRNGQVEEWDAFEAAVIGRPGAAPGLAEVFWAHQDYPAALARWTRHVPPENVHVVGLVRGGELWHDVARVFGVDPDVATAPAVAGVNRSLGMQQAELLRLVNLRLRDRIGFREYSTVVKFLLAMEVLGEQDDPRPIRLAPDAFAAVSERHDGFLAAARAAGYDVDDRLDALDPGAPAGPADRAAVSDALPGLTLGADVLADFIVKMVEEHYEVDPVGKLRRAALDLVEVRPAARRALHAYLRAKHAVGRYRTPPAA